MPTVTAADEALVSCSQNAAYSATIMAAQIRSAKPQPESGNPATVTVRRTLCTRVTAYLGFRMRKVRIDLDADIVQDAALATGGPSPPPMVAWAVSLANFCQRSQPPWAAIGFSNRSLISSSSFSILFRRSLELGLQDDLFGTLATFRA